ncbi:hypothetical protein SDC9_149476 [bioreactor metagenome]|uniref:Uncharacterized protein n=1 Tax=bioreactor metagenome TaxID=1076179 RepID=A0A645ELV1_9ZZZZ
MKQQLPGMNEKLLDGNALYAVKLLKEQIRLKYALYVG